MPTPRFGLHRSLACLALLLPLAAIGDAAAESLTVPRTDLVCQVVGETDRRTGERIANATESRAALWGTDLGIPVEHQGRLYVLFGDSQPTPSVVRARDGDPIATTSDVSGTDCLDLEFIVDRDGGYRPLAIPGVALGEYGVPSGGVSVGERLFVFATTDFSPENPMGQSVLASSADGARTFAFHRNVSRDKFINVSAQRVSGAAAGLPEESEAVLLWGSGRYRKSHPYLAVAPADGFADLTGIRFFRGVDPENGQPLWSERETEAVPLFDQPCIGEISVAWSPQIGRWLMTYNCDTPGLPAQVHIRVSARPWGPWSAPAVLLDAPGGYARCLFNPPPDSASPCRISDPKNEEVVGGPYGPYLIGRFFAAVGDGAAEVYYTLSTWNPYTVVLMRSTIRLDP